MWAWYCVALLAVRTSAHRLANIDRNGDVCGGQCRAAVLLAAKDLSRVWNTSLSLNPVFLSYNSNRLPDPSKLSTVDAVLSSVANHATSLPDILTAMALPYIEYQSRDPKFSVSDRYPHFLRMSSSALSEGKALVDILSQGYNWHRVVVLTTHDSYWQHVVTSFQQAAASQHIQTDIYYPLSEASIHTCLRRIQSTWRHIYILLMSSTDAGSLLRVAQDIHFFQEGTQIVGPTSLSSFEAINYLISEGIDPAVFTGYIGLQQDNTVVGNHGREFVARWRSQAATRIDHEDGSVWCSNATDDDGQYIYYDPSAPQNCSGLDFRLFAEDGSDIHSSAILAYDATISLALAMNFTLSQELDASTRNIFESITSTERWGISGLVGFGDTSSEAALGVGDRSLGLRYRLVNYQLHNDNATLGTIGEWRSESGFTFCESTNSNCVIPVYNTANPSTPPTDSRYVLRDMASEYRLALFAFSIACGGVSILLYFFMWSHRQSILVKVSQPSLSAVVLLGCLMGCVHAWLFSRDVTDSSCLMHVWFSHTSIFVIVVTLVLKAWRVYAVVEGRDEKVKIATQTLLISIFLAVCVLWALLALLSILHPPQSTEIVAHRRHEIPIYDRMCADADIFASPIHTTLLVVQVSVFFVGLWLAYVTRHIPEGVGDSLKIGQVISSFVLIALVGCVVLYTIELTPSTQRFVVAICFLSAICRVLNLLFGDMVFNLIRGYDLNGDFSLAKLRSSSSFFGRLMSRNARVSDISPSSSDSSRIKKSYSAEELEKEVSKCKRKLTKYRLQLQTVQELAIKRNFDMLSRRASWSRSSSQLIQVPMLRQTATAHADSCPAFDDCVHSFHVVDDNVA